MIGDNAKNATNVGGTGLTFTQLNNLLSLFNKNDGPTDVKENAHEDDTNLVSFGNLAGTFCFLSQSLFNNWIIDSGAIDHMCNTISLFKNIKSIDSNKIEVIIPGGS